MENSDAVSDSRSGAFPTTQWSEVLEVGRTDSPQARRALENLCQAYWYPLYAFVRRRGHKPHEAQDLTQDFFAHLFEKDALKGIARDKGKFRSFLLASLVNLLNNHWDKRRALKRGGDRQFVSFDACRAEELYRHEPVDHMTPERLFERRWALLLIERALARLEAEHAIPADRAFFDAARPWLTAEADAATRVALGGRLNMSEGAVKVALHRFRRRFGELLRREVAHTVSSPDEVGAELQHLLNVLVE